MSEQPEQFEDDEEMTAAEAMDVACGLEPAAVPANCGAEVTK